MKTTSLVLTIIVALAAALPAFAAEKKPEPGDRKPAKKVAGPNGGRIIATVEPRAEFFVTADRKVQITFLDQAGKAIAPADQAVTVTTGDRLAPTTLSFAKSGNTLLSTATLPAGNDLPTVVQIKAGPGGKTTTARFNVDLGKCGECKLAEYACICAH